MSVMFVVCIVGGVDVRTNCTHAHMYRISARGLQTTLTIAIVAVAP